VCWLEAVATGGGLIREERSSRPRRHPRHWHDETYTFRSPCCAMHVASYHGHLPTTARRDRAHLRLWVLPARVWCGVLHMHPVSTGFIVHELSTACVRCCDPRPTPLVIVPTIASTFWLPDLGAACSAMDPCTRAPSRTSSPQHVRGAAAHSHL
jgi:hypothetical protein